MTKAIADFLAIAPLEISPDWTIPHFAAQPIARPTGNWVVLKIGWC
jgi:hypothetical protein